MLLEMSGVDQGRTDRILAERCGQNLSTARWRSRGTITEPETWGVAMSLDNEDVRIRLETLPFHSA